MIVTDAFNSLKEKIVQRAKGCGQEIFINKVLLGEQYLTCENVFAGKPNVDSIHFHCWDTISHSLGVLPRSPSGTIWEGSLCYRQTNNSPKKVWRNNRTSCCQQGMG